MLPKLEDEKKKSNATSYMNYIIKTKTTMNSFAHTLIAIENNIKIFILCFYF